MTTSLAGSKPSYKAILKENSFLWFRQRKERDAVDFGLLQPQNMLWQQMTKLFLWLDLHQAKLAVFKATGNPTGDGEKSVSVEVWDQAFMFQSFASPWQDAEPSTWHQESSVQSQFWYSSFHGLVGCSCEALGAAYPSRAAISLPVKWGQKCQPQRLCQGRL